MTPPWPAPVKARPALKLPKLCMTLLTLEGVRIAALVDVQKEMVSLSSATEGTELVLEASLLLIDFQFLRPRTAPPPYSSVTRESAM